MPRYLSTASAAEQIDMSRKWVHVQIKAGNLPAVNIAPEGARPRYRILEDELQAFMERGGGPIPDTADAHAARVPA